MNLQKIGIKFFAEDSATVSVRSFIPIFHGWIQKQAVENHLLIDVHNYSHIHSGPGILLVAQEGNFSIDMADGRMGLLYQRKKPAGLESVVKTALQACKLLESEPALVGRLRFRAGEMLIVANDRLLAPNDEKTFEELKQEIGAALPGKFTLKRVSMNPKERLTILAREQ